jgi:Uma2 family endonuclease
MSTRIQTTSSANARPSTKSGLVPYRLTVRQFKRMIDARIFSDDERVELLGGVLVDSMTKNDPHNFTVGELGEALRVIVKRERVVREEKSIVLGRYSRPEPDLAIARGPRSRYRVVSPTPLDLELLIDVADTTYAIDRGKKWTQYAASRIPVYWIVNLPERRVEVYSEPSGRGKAASYQSTVMYGPDDKVPVVLQGRELGQLKVREILP